MANADILHNEDELPAEQVCEVCATCSDPSTLRFCRACLTCVHRTCYGVDAEEGRMFLCQRCIELGPKNSQICKICQVSNGAIRRINDDWVHVQCALFSARFRLTSIRKMEFEFVTGTYLRTQLCKLCGKEGEALCCQNCNMAAHFRCAITAPAWDVSLVYTGKRFLSCPDHPLAAKRCCPVCKRIVKDKESSCTLCEVWFHSACVSSPAFVCDPCSTWKVLFQGLQRDCRALKGPFPESGLSLRLSDYILLWRLFETRSEKCLTSLCTSDDLRDVMSLSKFLVFPHKSLEEIHSKANSAAKLTTSIHDLAQQVRQLRHDCTAIVSLEAAAKDAGLIVPQLAHLKTLCLQNELVAEVKEMLFSPQTHSIDSAKSVLATAVERLGADSRWVETLQSAIQRTEQWQGTVAHFFESSDSSQLMLSEAEKLLSDGRALPLSVPTQYTQSLESAIAWAEQWEKEDKCAFKPYSPEYVRSAFAGKKPVVWTARMSEVWSLAERLAEWEGRTACILAGTSPPTLSDLCLHLHSGKDTLLPSVNIFEPLSCLQAAYDSAVRWRDSARATLEQGLSPQHMFSLLETSHTLLCTFEELLEVRRRAGVNLSIENSLRGTLTEQALMDLRAEAERLRADPAHFHEVEERVRMMQELKERISRATGAGASLEDCSRLLAEISAQRFELPEDSARLADAITSLALMKRFDECMMDRTEIEALLVEASKVQNKLPELQAACSQLAERFWELECERVEKASELTVEEVGVLEAKLERIPCTQLGSAGIIAKVGGLQEAISYCEGLISQPVESLFGRDLAKLSAELTAARSTFNKGRLVVPAQFEQLFRYVDWIGWSINVQSALNASTKPPIDLVCELRDSGRVLSVPAALPCASAIEQVLKAYEEWSSRLLVLCEPRQWYTGDTELMLRVVREHPKPPYQVATQLLQDCDLLPCECSRQRVALQSEIEKAESWLKKAHSVLRPDVYFALLKAAKRSYRNTKDLPMFAALSSAISEYIREVQFRYDDFDVRFCAYSWNFAALCILQRSETTSAQYWESFCSQIPHIAEKYRDTILVERVRMQESKRTRVETALQELHENGPALLSLDDCYSLKEHIVGCRVEISQTESLNRVISRASEIVQRAETLMAEKAPRSSFERLKAEIDALPVTVPEISEKLTQVMEKATSLGRRIEEMQETMQKSRVPRAQVEALLTECDLLPIKLSEIEPVAECLESAKEVLKDAHKAVSASSLPFILRSLSRLDSTSIHLGLEETSLRCKLWKRKYRLALESSPKLPFETFQQWFAEGDCMTDLDFDRDLHDLEKYMEAGEALKKRIETASQPEVARILKDAQALPFDLSSFLAVPYTSERATIPAATPHPISESSDYIPPKRHRPSEAELTTLANPGRGTAVATVESVLMADELIPKECARSLASKIEGWLFRSHGQGKAYDLAVQETVRMLDILMSYEGFAEKLMSGAVRWKAIRKLKPEEAVRNTQRKPEIVREIFREQPKVVMRIQTPKVESEAAPYKILRTSTSKDPKKSEPSKSAKPSRKPPSNTLVELINDFKHFTEQQHPKELEFAIPSESERPKPAKRQAPPSGPEPPAKLSKGAGGVAQFSPDRDSNAKTDQSGEYRILDFANTDKRAEKRIPGRMYDPLAPKAAPLNSAAPGSLLKVWSGALIYNKQLVLVDMFSVDAITSFHTVPQLSWRLEVAGRTKMEELGEYLKGNIFPLGLRNIVTAWVEPAEGGESEFKSLSRELAEKNRAAVIRYSPNLTLYVTVLTESFKVILDTLKVNVLQRLDRAVAASMSDQEKLACFLVLKKPTTGAGVLNPSVVVYAEGVEGEGRQLSPVSEEDDSDSQLVLRIIEKLQNNEQLEAKDLVQLKELLLQNQSPEVSALIANINARLQNEKPREAGENNVTEFLSMQSSAAKGKTQQVDPRSMYRFA